MGPMGGRGGLDCSVLCDGSACGGIEHSMKHACTSIISRVGGGVAGPGAYIYRYTIGYTNNCHAMAPGPRSLGSDLGTNHGFDAARVSVLC